MYQKFLKIIFIFIIIISILSIFVISNSNQINNNLIENSEIEEKTILISSDGKYAWPIPGYSQITSKFGPRKAPAQGASKSFHYGTDIGAPEGTKLVAISDGIVSFLGFLGGGGYTLTLSFNQYKITYCHIDYNFLVKEGQVVKRGEVIAKVGPKYVYNVPNNKYKDSSGRPTNGATTGVHFHIGVRLNNVYRNPMELFE